MTSHEDVRIYPRPGAVGGGLIREAIGLLKEQGLQLPLTSHILIATSGGSDSIGLAHLITRYGRRIVSNTQISLLHINHGWRGVESDQDEAFVQELGIRWNVPVIVHRLKNPSLHSGETPNKASSSWEEQARTERKAIFRKEAQIHNALVFTAHQADDLAETLLWRLFTGAIDTHGGGIILKHGFEVRPFLSTRKKTIESYLKEEGLVFRPDSTNFQGRFLRSRMRKQLMPELERLFPRAVQHLVIEALKAQRDLKVESSNSGGLSQEKGDTLLPYKILFQAAGLRPRRPHFEELVEKLIAKKAWWGEIHLPGGWKLKREKIKKPKVKLMVNACDQTEKQPPVDRWVLEQTL